jgi:predicted Zn-dependent peptidase
LRTLRRLVILLFLVALASCAPRAEAPIVVTSPQRLQRLALDNGLVVVLDPDASATSAVVRVRYHVGAKDDPSGRAGLAHLVEHLTFQMAPRAGVLDRYASLERAGAVDVNGETALDFTDYHATVPPSVLAYALWLEASRMSEPVALADEAALRRELAVVKNELRFRAGAHTYGLANMLVAEALFGTTHPYGRIVNMTRNEIDDVGLPELQAFTALHYQPSNAVLVVSGRFDVEEARRLVQVYFGRIRSRASPPRDVLPAPRLARDEFTTFAAPVRAREIAIGWLAPPPETDGYDEMVLASSVMTAHLRERLTTDLGLVDDVQVGLQPGHLGSMLIVAAKLHDGASPERTASEIDRGMSLVASLGRTFEWDQFGAVRLRLATKIIVDLESPASRALGIQHDLEYAGVVRTAAQDVARVQRLHPSDVGGATKQFIVDARRVAIVLEPDRKAPPAGARR